MQFNQGLFPTSMALGEAPISAYFSRLTKTKGKENGRPKQYHSKRKRSTESFSQPPQSPKRRRLPLPPSSPEETDYDEPPTLLPPTLLPTIKKSKGAQMPVKTPVSSRKGKATSSTVQLQTPPLTDEPNPRKIARTSNVFSIPGKADFTLQFQPPHTFNPFPTPLSPRKRNRPRLPTSPYKPNLQLSPSATDSRQIIVPEVVPSSQLSEHDVGPTEVADSPEYRKTKEVIPSSQSQEHFIISLSPCEDREDSDVIKVVASSQPLEDDLLLLTCAHITKVSPQKADKNTSRPRNSPLKVDGGLTTPKSQQPEVRTDSQWFGYPDSPPKSPLSGPERSSYRRRRRQSSSSDCGSTRESGYEGGSSQHDPFASHFTQTQSPEEARSRQYVHEQTPLTSFENVYSMTQSHFTNHQPLSEALNAADDFCDMFDQDGSYPDSFPMSLR